jgi:hypothetical protein
MKNKEKQKISQELFSIGDIIDRIIIENIKIFTIREKLHNNNIKKSDKEYVILFNKMSDITKNRNILVTFLDKKIDGVLSGNEKNVIFQMVKTY